MGDGLYCRQRIVTGGALNDEVLDVAMTLSGDAGNRLPHGLSRFIDSGNNGSFHMDAIAQRGNRDQWSLVAGRLSRLILVLVCSLEDAVYATQIQR